MKARSVSGVGCRVSAVAMLTAALLAGTARGTTYYVAQGGTGDGTSWSSPTNSIQGAVNAPGCDLVLVSNGTYNITAEIAISAGITVRGYWNGVAGGLSSASNTVVRRSGGATRIFNISAAGAVLDGLTIQEGFMNTGGGVYMTGGLVEHCIIRNNGGGDGGKGGGVYMTGGTVSNCTISANAVDHDGQGGGIRASGSSQILYCRILENRGGKIGNDAGGLGGGIYIDSLSTVLVRNCLIARNMTGKMYSNDCGAGVYMNSGTVESCTIVSNIVQRSDGGGVGGGIYRNGNGTVRNCVIYFNRDVVQDVVDNYYGLDSDNTTYSCTTPALGGNNVDSVQLVDLAGGDYRLKACAAVDSGTNQSWMAGALDLGGNPRTNGVNNRVDMGAYELMPGALECALAADVTSVLAPSSVVFTATVSGSNLTSLAYTWEFGNGTSTNGPALGVVTNLYVSPRAYTVTLTVSNAVNEIARATNLNYIAAWAADAYVRTDSSSPGAPYHTWSNAAHTLGAVFLAAPAGVTTIWLTNGTYSESGTITLSGARTVRSVEGGLSGASNTIVRAGLYSFRLFNMTHANAVIRGLTIRDASGGSNGQGVYMTDGLVRDCIVRNNGYNDHTDGVGVYMTGGAVSNCIVTANVGYHDCQGGGIYASGNSQILFCQIFDNQAGKDGGDANGHGGGVYINGASVVVRNCLIATNRTGSVNNAGEGAGVYLNNGTVESCTIVGNVLRRTDGNGIGGGIRYVNGAVKNSIVYFNTNAGAGGATDNYYGLDSGNTTYSCTTPALGGDNIAADPLFAGAATNNYRLQVKPAVSPCIDAGTNQAWMATATDLDGKARIQKGTKRSVDMGAYETYVAPAGTVLVLR